jgi:hypothetical protein
MQNCTRMRSAAGLAAVLCLVGALAWCASAGAVTPWLGLNGNSGFEAGGGLGLFAEHDVVFDRGGPHVWGDGVEFEAGELPGAGDSLSRSMGARLVPVVSIEYDGYFSHWWGSDSKFPHTPKGSKNTYRVS